MRTAFDIQFWLLLYVTVFSFPACAQMIENRTSKYYEIGKTNEAPLFTQHIIVETSATGDRSWNSEIKDASGTDIIGETALIKGNKVVSQTVNNSQSHETCELVVDPEKVTYRLYHYIDGKRGDLIEEKIRAKEENFITGPAVEFYLAQRWEQLNAGTTVEVQFGIFEILRSIGFELKKEGETDQVLKVKMKPSNFFISLLVDPIHLEFDKATKRLVHYKGRTPLRRNRDGKLKPWDAEVVYDLL